MYSLSRMLLVLCAIAGLYSLAMVALIGWPTSAFWIGVIGLIVFLVNRRRRQLTTLGSARWANEEDLQRAGMLSAASGLILGRLPSMMRGRSASRFSKLFARGVSAKEACRAFWPRFFGRNDVVRLPQAIHTSVFSPSGGGKGVSCVIPFLLTCEESCVVVDFKGENALRTARHRHNTFGHQIVLLDPFKVVTQSPDCFNPIDFIAKENPCAIDHCNDLAKALVIRSADEREPHWNDSAEAWIAAVLATVVQYGGEDSRSLQTLREILSHPQRLDLALKLMGESDCRGGMLARMGGQLLHFVEKERASVLTTVSRHLRFLDTLAITESTKQSSFDPAKLCTGKMTVYLVLPPEHMRAQSPLLRVWIGSLLRAVVSGGLQERNKVHFILDEAASLGQMDAIDDAVDKYRGYGVRLQFYFQSLGQLKKCFPEGQEQTLLSNSTQVFFGVNDNATAEYVSARLGEETIIVDSGGNSSGSSTNWSSGSRPQHGGGGSTSSNSNWQQQARKLLKPEEVMALSPRTAITFMAGVLPICTTLLRYYEERRLPQRPGWVKRSFAACLTFTASLAMCFVMAAFAFVLTMIASDEARVQSEMPGPAQYENEEFVEW